MAVTRRAVLLAVVLAVGVLPGIAGATTYAGSVRVSGPALADRDVGLNETISPDGKWLVFAADRAVDDRFDLWSVRLDGTAGTPIRLSTIPNPDGDVLDGFRITPDSSRVVYHGDLDDEGTVALYSAPIDASNGQIRLSHLPLFDGDVASFEIAPDGVRVAFVGDLHTDERTEMYGAAVGTALSQIRLNATPVAGGELTGLYEITADSARVVYDGDLTDDGRRELYSAPLDQTGQQIRLNDTPVAGGGVQPAGGMWQLSPDGSRVVYMGDLDVDERVELYSAPVGASGQQVRLNDDPVVGGAVGHDHTITPDSQRVVFRADLDVNDQTEVYSAPIDAAGQQIQLNDEPQGDVLDMAVTPDGSRVVFIGQIDDPVDRALYSAPVAQSGQQIMLSTPSAVGDVDYLWQITPDSARILYVADLTVTGRYDLYSAPVGSTGGQLRIGGPADVNGDIDDLEITPDGRRAVLCADFTVDDQYELFSVRVDVAGQQLRLTTNPAGGDADCSDWSVAPDSSRVAYIGNLLDIDHEELFSAPLSAAGEQLRINDPLPDQSDIYDAQFSADASFVVYRGDPAVYNQVELWASSRGQQPPSSPPSQVKVTNVTETTAKVTWTRPPVSEATGYTVFADPVTGSTETVPTTGTSTTLTGLAAGTKYTVTVVASNPGGASAPSAPVVFTTGTAQAPTPDGVHRLWGADRYETAAAVALDRFLPAAVDTVYLATGTAFPDALAGGPLAAAGDAPILLTAPTSLPDATADALATLAPSQVVALGGSSAISDEALAAAGDAAGGADVDRLFGADRYATAAAIAAALPATGTVYLAVGTNFPDALAGGAATGGAPILLSTTSSLPDATAQALADLAPAKVVALGGAAVVSDDVLAAAATAAGGAATSRLSGNDRFETALRIAETLPAPDTLYVATGLNFPDALTAGPAATAEGAPIVLTPTGALTADVEAWIDGLAGLRRVVVLGGTTAVGADVESQLEDLLD